MKKLALYPLSDINELASPEQSAALSLQSPATAFLTDFKQTLALTIPVDMSASDARELMIKTHVRLKFVVDAKGRLQGVISADDLAERKIVKQVARGISRDEVLVRDLMQPRKELMGLDIDEVKGATIEDVVKLLKDYHQQHCLVIDRNDGTIRGIFSASDISRRLKLPINIQDQSDFYRVFTATKG